MTQQNPVAWRPWTVGLACLAATAAPAADFAILVQGQPAGHARIVAVGEGRYETDHHHRDNGRGPDVKERFTLDARGVPVAYEASGRSTFGGVVAERFALEGGRARWTSRADEGEEPAGEDFLFLPLDASPAYLDHALRRLLASPGASAPTIGGARLAVERLASVTLPGAGQAVPLQLVAVTGADASPWYLWVRDDGTNALFAQLQPGWSTIEQGQEAAAAGLLERQQRAQDERLVALRQRLARPLDGTTLIRAVRWFDAPAARVRGPSDVWIFDGRIGAVTPPGALAVEADRVVDGAGRTLLPGLWDMHAHLWPEAGLQHLAAGVTSVRDPGGQNDALLRLAGRLRRGEIPGPDLHLAGFIEGTSPFSSRNGVVVDSLERGLEAVDWYAARGYRSIKLYNSVRPGWVRPLAQRAHALGLKVSGHVPAFMLAEAAVRDGYDELTHVNQLMLNFVTRPGDDPRTLMRFERVGQDGHRLDLRSAKARAFLRLLRERGTVVDPTLGAFEGMFTQAPGQVNPGAVAVADHLPALWRRYVRAAEMDLPGAKLQTFRGSYRRMLELVAALHRAGVPIVPGTDGWPGFGLHRELELYVQAGIPAGEALRMATWGAARHAGEGDRRGRIERGYVADLLLVEGDPVADIGAVRRGSLVIQGTVAWEPARLHEAMGFKPFVEPPPIARRDAAPRL